MSNDMNSEKLITAFSNALEIDKGFINDDLSYQGIPEWDSITHMFLIDEIENTFGIEIDPDDVLEFSNYKKVREKLSKYEVEF
jgi:acyl carrier protein